VTADLDRLRAEYARRRNDVADKALYSSFNPAHLFAIQQRQRATLRLLRQQGITSLRGKRILEVGCGSGGVLLEFLGYGAEADALVGIDLLPDRLSDGKRRLPGLNFACADGQRLPFPAGQFDLVLQYTAFSSVLDAQIKANMAAEMLRVLRPDGCILWYDFWLNPTNPQTKGIRGSEIRRLFPDCAFAFRRVTLAPPIARRLVPVSWIGGLLLEKLSILNTHFLAIIRPSYT
jgi:ubiquinone/menaquinone biosynthesis C-methylase UbiE